LKLTGEREYPAMATHTNSRPARSSAPAVIRHTLAPTTTNARDIWRFVPAAILSAIVNCAFAALLLLIPTPGAGNDKMERNPDDMDAKPLDEPKNKDTEPPPITATDVDEDAKDNSDDDIVYQNKRIEDKSVPGDLRPNDPIGIEGAQGDPIASIAAPSGFGGGTGRAADGGPDGVGQNYGEKGGYNGGYGKPLGGTFYGRSGATKEAALRDGGGTGKSEAAVGLGLQWIARHQNRDGSWSLDHFRCNCGGKGQHNNDIAGTAFGLLPLLGAGHTNKRPKDYKEGKPKYYLNVDRGLKFLRLKQSQRTGDYGGGMYSHGLATITVCEAYGLTQDPNLKRSAQMAVNFIQAAQHSAGGWRYSPGEAGDTSVVGWQVMALKSAQMANLNVKPKVLQKAISYLDDVMDDNNYGYGYTGKGSAPTTSAVGLLCRMYLQGWGPAVPKMNKGVDAWIKPYAPGTGMKNMYYYYYATQVMHHLNNEAWKTYNVKMRDSLISTQDKGADPVHKDQKGSWSPEGDQWGAVGGRLMVTSLSLLTLEVYYRHLPLYRRDTMEKK
jgi:hypothetical protein